MAWTEEKVQQTLAKVTKKATNDREFRTLVLKNPNEAIKQISGEAIPESFTLRFVENEGATLTMVLPDFIESKELADEDLEAVAGGTYAPVRTIDGPCINTYHCKPPQTP